MPIVTVINAAPASISPDEHRERTAATPASFADIPPVLRYKEENARVVLDPPVADLTEDELKKGTVYIIESVLAFISASSGRGFQVEYPSIILHAISRANPGPCIYCQLDEPSPQEQDNGAEEEEASELRELKIIPEDASSLDALFEALSLCASLHPDPPSGSDLDDDMGMGIGLDGDDAFVDADVESIQALVAEGVDGEPELNESGRATLERLESLIQDPRGELDGVAAVNGFHERAAEGSDEGEQFADAEPRS